MSQTTKIILAVITVVIMVILAVLIAGQTGFFAKDKIIESDPLIYSVEDIDASVNKKAVPFDYTAEQLVAMARECGHDIDQDYINDLVVKFAGTDKLVYEFEYQGESQNPDTYTVTLLPHKPDYASFDQFEKDFDTCSAGGDAYPYMLNDDWLVFVSSCGTGYEDDSGKPVGCQEIREAVESSLKLK